MRFLCVLGLGFIDRRLRRHFVFSVTLRYELTHFVNGLLRQIDGVGTHVGDQTDGLTADIQPFIQLLGDPHGATGRESQLARGLLLERGGGKRGCGVAFALLFLDRVDDQLAAGCSEKFLFRMLCAGLIGDRKLLDLRPVQLDQAGRESLFVLVEIAFQRPVFAGCEIINFDLALHDHAQRRALHATG